MKRVSLFDEGADSVRWDIMKFLYFAGGPFDFDVVDFVCGAEAEMNAWVVARAVAVIGLDLFAPELSCGRDLDDGVMGAGLAFVEHRQCYPMARGLGYVPQEVHGTIF